VETRVLSKALPLLKRRYLSANPFFVVFHVTARCNAKCHFCFNWENIDNWRQRKELTLEEIERFTKKLGPIFQLTLGGGEPFIRHDLHEIVTLFRKNCDVQTVTIPTNAVLTDRVARVLPKMLAENPSVHVRLGLSLPELGEALDRTYEIKDAFKKHQATFAVAREIATRYSNLTLNVGICCNKYNLEKVKEILDYVRTQMPGCKPQLAVVRGNPRRIDSKAVDVEGLADVYAYYKRQFGEADNRPFGSVIARLGEAVNDLNLETVRTNRWQLPCRSGEKLVLIYDNGDVFPCEYRDDNLGNLRDFDYDVHAILATEKTRGVVRDIVENKCFCTWECANYNNIMFSTKYASTVMGSYVTQGIGRLLTARA
jgi:molybdenum cofactor biosynthesis enzyme MoaA